MKKQLLLSTFVTIVILAACKKDDKNNNTPGIEGSYKLKYFTAKTNSTTTESDGEKGVATSDYTTINNQGTVVFTSSTVTSTGVTYTVDTQAKYYVYDGADLIDSSTDPFTYTLPPTTSVGQYQLISADSIYFSQGSITSGVGGMGSTQGSAGGGKYSLSGNLLTITQIGSKDSTFEDSGETIHLVESAVSSIVLEKQ